MTRTLVTGGTGFIGSHLVDALLERGDEVVCTVRPSSDLRWLSGKRVRLVSADLTRPEDLEPALGGVERVFHLAGATIARPQPGFLEANEGMTRTVVAALTTTGRPIRLIYLSSLAALGPSRPGHPLVEEMEAHPVSDYGRSKLAAERAVTAAAGDLPVAIVRAPVVFGPRDQGLLTAFRLVRRRVLPLIGRERLLSLIAVPDLVRGLLLVMESEKAAGRAYHLAHEEPMSMAELGGAIARAMGVRTLAIPVPDTLVRAGAAISGLAGRFRSQPSPFTADKALEMTQAGWVCSVERANRELGFRAVLRHHDALRETAAWYRREQWL